MAAAHGHLTFYVAHAMINPAFPAARLVVLAGVLMTIVHLLTLSIVKPADDKELRR